MRKSPCTAIPSPHTKTTLFEGWGWLCTGYYEVQSDGNCTLGGREGGLKIQFFWRDFSGKHVIRPTPYQADLSL